MDDHGALLPPPSLPNDQRTSMWSTASGESIWTLSSDSKYPSGPQTARGGLVPYAWDPTMDDQENTDEDDLLHGPESADKPPSFLNSRSVLNLGVLVLLIGALLGLFIALPVVSYVDDNARTVFLSETGSNTIDNDKPQDAHAVPSLIDPDTPETAKTRIGYDNQRYKLVFSDEFNQDGRTFYPGDDPFGKQSIFGMTPLVTSSGTVQIWSIPAMVPFTSGSRMLQTMGCRIALVCSRAGTSFASLAVTSRSLSPFPVPMMRLLHYVSFPASSLTSLFWYHSHPFT
jgi:hypothetical protein